MGNTSSGSSSLQRGPFFVQVLQDDGVTKSMVALPHAKVSLAVVRKVMELPMDVALGCRRPADDISAILSHQERIITVQELIDQGLELGIVGSNKKKRPPPPEETSTEDPPQKQAKDHHVNTISDNFSAVQEVSSETAAMVVEKEETASPNSLTTPRNVLVFDTPLAPPQDAFAAMVIPTVLSSNETPTHSNSTQESVAPDCALDDDQTPPIQAGTVPQDKDSAGTLPDGTPQNGMVVGAEKVVEDTCVEVGATVTQQSHATVEVGMQEPSGNQQQKPRGTIVDTATAPVDRVGDGSLLQPPHENDVVDDNGDASAGATRVDEDCICSRSHGETDGDRPTGGAQSDPGSDVDHLPDDDMQLQPHECAREDYDGDASAGVSSADEDGLCYSQAQCETQYSDDDDDDDSATREPKSTYDDGDDSVEGSVIHPVAPAATRDGAATEGAPSTFSSDSTMDAQHDTEDAFGPPDAEQDNTCAVVSSRLADDDDDVTMLDVPVESTIAEVVGAPSDGSCSDTSAGAPRDDVETATSAVSGQQIEEEKLGVDVAAIDVNGLVDESSSNDHGSGAVGEEAESVLVMDESDDTTEYEGHQKCDAAIQKTCSVLSSVQTLLQDNALFCSEKRRQDLLSEIKGLLHNQESPQTYIGVIGNTGVGKSSLLNSLLDESSILPTSGSRGCTATVVELRFNKALKAEFSGTRPVYKGHVEFLSFDEWLQELTLLVDECCTLDNKTVYARSPEGNAQAEAAAAWSKINQVYGAGTMEKFKTEKGERVLDYLSNHPRVRSLLSPNGENSIPNSIRVDSGEVDCAQARALLTGLDIMGPKLKRRLRKWGKDFRAKINNYVYRKGSGTEPQTWPLIRKVELEGPWRVLSTGACLVDLPGVRDANAARAKVSENYLQNCSKLWIAAPIKRAVDDGTAKELMGENFKRRLLMDGQYGCISFICTQTDDCESSETIADHQDIARSMGTWESIQALSNEINTIECEIADLGDKVEAIDGRLETIVEYLSDDSDEEGDVEERESLIAEKHRIEAEISDRSSFLNNKAIQLKSICALVRNMYSKTKIQADFREGLDELVSSRNEGAEGDHGPIPDDFSLDVFCVSANDYLKIKSIKSASDGLANTFSRVEDTEIPALREFTHTTTSEFKRSFAESFVDKAFNLLDHVKLIASDAQGVSISCRNSRHFRNAFERTLKCLNEVEVIAQGFHSAAVTRINAELKSSISKATTKGVLAADGIVASWASRSYRTKSERGASRNGLKYPTYNAAVRRYGEYVSPTAGEINLNQELCDPMEEQFSADWQQIMDDAMRKLLRDTEQQIHALCTRLDTTLASALLEARVDPSRLRSLRATSLRSCQTMVKGAFASMRSTASNGQRVLNRSLLPKVREGMSKSYNNALSCPRGPGTFRRMDNAMRQTSNSQVEGIFSEATNTLLAEIVSLVKSIEAMILALAPSISKTTEGVYSMMWESSEDPVSSDGGMVDPAHKQRIRACRDTLARSFAQLSVTQAEAMALLGIEREALELEMVAVDSMEQLLAKKALEAEKNGMLVDLCDSSDDGDTTIPSSEDVQVPNVKSECI